MRGKSLAASINPGSCNQRDAVDLFTATALANSVALMPWCCETNGFPVFSAGRNPVDTKFRGKMIWADVPAVIGQVEINSGDLIVVDIDGIVVLPSAIAEKVVAKALDKVRIETTVRQELRDGATLVEVFEKHGIL